VQQQRQAAPQYGPPPGSEPRPGRVPDREPDRESGTDKPGRRKKAVEYVKAKLRRFKDLAR